MDTLPVHLLSSKYRFSFVCLSVCLSFWLSVCLSVCLSVRLLISLSPSLSVLLSLILFLSISNSLSLYLSPSPSLPLSLSLSFSFSFSPYFNKACNVFLFSHQHVILAEFDFSVPIQNLETFPIDQGKPRRTMFWMKSYLMPIVYKIMLM